MTHRYAISRRTVLQGAGAAVALPLLDVMRPFTEGADRAAITASESVANTTAASPRRLAYLYFPNGAASGSWDPASIGADSRLQKLNPWMAPLEPLRDRISVIRNMWTPEGNGHGAGTATWLTAGDFIERRIDAGGTSADQLAAQLVGDQTLLPSLELSMRGEGFFSNSLVRNTLSWTDRNTPAPRDVEPRAVFDRMFRRGQASRSERSLVDLVLEDARSLKRRSSLDDRRKLEEYLESIRRVERRLAFADRRLEASPKLKRQLRRPGPGIPDSHQDYMRLMLEMIVLAFWADATRISTFMLDHGQSNRYCNFVDGVKGTWHALSHWRDYDGKTEDDDGITSWSSAEEKQRMYNLVTRWHHEQVGWFLERLASIRENGKSLLDQSMIVYGSSLSDGHAHSEDNLPLILAGGGAGSIHQGRLIKPRRDVSMSRLHLALLQRLGVPVIRFGETTQPLSLA